MNRREFIRCGAGLAGIIAAGKAPAAVVRSMIGAMQTEIASKADGWENPYVTDGLVAMWDGEWNVGLGIHDSEATVWKDLAGTWDLSISNNGIFIDNALKNTDMSKAVAYSEPVTILLGDVQTIEILCKGWRADASGYDYFSLGTLRTANRYGNYCARYSILAGNSHDIHQYGVPISLVNNGMAHTVSFNYADYGSTNYAPTHSYVDGSEITMQFQSAGKDGGNGRITIGGASKDSTYMVVPANTLFYNIRLYSRALTAAEIAANYAIDKERFGL